MIFETPFKGAAKKIAVGEKQYPVVGTDKTSGNLLVESDDVVDGFNRREDLEAERASAPKGRSKAEEDAAFEARVQAEVDARLKADAEARAKTEAKK